VTTLVRYVDSDQQVHIGVSHDDGVFRLPAATLADLLAGDLDRLAAAVAAAADRPDPDVVARRAPVDGATEVWAAGVTYRRSRDARMEESLERDPYERVYVADRPELFFKSVAWRVSGPGEPVAIRADSTLDVPEPELAVVVTASGQIAGYTLCNDMSSRSIEGENPLYLPQAKTYAGACALGPGIVLAADVPDPGGLAIELEIRRGGAVAFAGRTDTGQMVRPLAGLVDWLYAEQYFPAGAVLSTGTGIVPDLGFTLADGDEVTVRADGLGALTNPVVRGKRAMAWQLPRTST
jgi:2-dehydro-3-deoxy-D-arabinonate dehydratase